MNLTWNGMAGPDLDMDIDLENPGPGDIAHSRELLERVGYDTKGMSDDEALGLLRHLMPGAPAAREDVSQA